MNINEWWLVIVIIIAASALFLQQLRLKAAKKLLMYFENRWVPSIEVGLARRSNGNFYYYFLNGLDLPLEEIYLSIVAQGDDGELEAITAELLIPSVGRCGQDSRDLGSRENKKIQRLAKNEFFDQKYGVFVRFKDSHVKWVRKPNGGINIAK